MKYLFLGLLVAGLLFVGCLGGGTNVPAEATPVVTATPVPTAPPSVNADSAINTIDSTLGTAASAGNATTDDSLDLDPQAYAA